MKLHQGVKKAARCIFSRKTFVALGALVLTLFSGDKGMQHNNEGHNEDLSKAPEDNFGHVVPKAYAAHPTGGDGSPGCPDAGGGGSDCPAPGSFVAGTRIMMADGTKKPVEHITFGDKTLGGEVTATMQFYADEGVTYDYKGILVSGGHIVYDEDNWRYVSESPRACQTDDPTNRTFYDFICTGHRIYIDGMTFTDYAELDSEHPLEEKRRREWLAYMQQKDERSTIKQTVHQPETVQ